MSKKSFKSGLDALIGGGEENLNREEPRIISKSSPEITKDTRATFVISEELVEKVKDIAYWERALIKEVVEEAFREYVEKYEKKNGSIKPRVNK